MKEPLVLYVEDEENDALLVRLAFQRTGLGCALEIVSNGVEAIDYLSGANDLVSGNSCRIPNLVLLDLNLPVRSGFEVLEWIRGQAVFTSLPVVVFTSSDRESDRERVRQLGASDFIVKPSDHKELVALARKFSQQYLTLEPSPK